MGPRNQGMPRLRSHLRPKGQRARGCARKRQDAPGGRRRSSSGNRQRIFQFCFCAEPRRHQAGQGRDQLRSRISPEMMPQRELQAITRELVAAPQKDSTPNLPLCISLRTARYHGVYARPGGTQTRLPGSSLQTRRLLQRRPTCSKRTPTGPRRTSEASKAHRDSPQNAPKWSTRPGGDLRGSREGDGGPQEGPIARRRAKGVRYLPPT